MSLIRTRYVRIIMAPVADCNLKAILNTHVLSQETYSRVRTFYGCLASALRYLHENQFRHKDIKPEVGEFAELSMVSS
jgi:serine/threonine protein kinase